MKKYWIGFSLLLIGICSFTLVAQDQPANQKADEILQKVASFYKSQKTLEAELKYVMHIETPQIKTNQTSISEIALERPDKLMIRLKEGMMGGTLVTDGKNLSIHSSMFNKHTVKEAKPLSEIFQDTDVAISVPVASVGLITAIVAEDPQAVVNQSFSKRTYLGEVEIEGKKYHHIKLETSIGANPGSMAHFELYTAASGDPVIFRVKPDLSKSVPPEVLQNQKIEMYTEYGKWKFGSPIPADRFAFVAPSVSQKVDSLLESLNSRPEPIGLGIPAPDFTLKNLEGKETALASHKGKDIVILDFWATWCGPCVKALPDLVSVTSAYKNKGVVFYAVNQQETVDQIKKFQKQEKLQFNSLLDPGEVAEKYGVTGIPQTVIVGKDGTIQAVHVGFSPDLKQKLTLELDTLLGGKKLAEASSQPVPPTASQQECIINLKQIEAAKQQWALENKKTAGSIPTDKDLFGITQYVKSKPVCPQGGTYFLNTLNKHPTCSHPGHELK